MLQANFDLFGLGGNNKIMMLSQFNWNFNSGTEIGNIKKPKDAIKTFVIMDIVQFNTKENWTTIVREVSRLDAFFK